MKRPSKFTVLFAACTLMACGAFVHSVVTARAWAVDKYQATPGKFRCVQVAVQTTATTVISGSSERNAWVIQNLGVNPLYCDGTASVTSNTGIQVPANGGILTADMFGGPNSASDTITCVTVSANQLGTGTANTRKCMVY